MFVSSKNRTLDSMRREEGQSVRAFVFSVLDAMETKAEIEFLDAPDFAIVRNYISTFSMNKGRKYRAASRPGGLWVRRDK